MNGKQLDGYIRSIFNLSPGDKITPEQLNYGLSMLDPVRYALSYHTIKGKPLTFDVPNYDTSRALAHRPWQKEILRASASDEHNVVVIKSRQLGLSELGVMSCINWLDTHSAQGVRGLYTFPTQQQMFDFFKTRIVPEFNKGYYKSLTSKNNFSVNKMKIRNADLFFRSSSKGSAMEGIDVDFVSLDEYDRLNPLAEQSAIESMSSSKYKCLRRWSTPTAPGVYIDKLYNESDQRHYYHECTHCGYKQVLDYNKNIELVNPDGIDTISKVIQPGTYRFVCQKCGKPLDRWYNGFWHADNPGAGRDMGFMISQMNAVWVSADHLKQQELRAPSKAYFYNYTLGFPYKDDSHAFLESDVTDHIGDFPMQENRGDYSKVVAGIDWGQHEHSVVLLGIKETGMIDVIRMFRVKRSIGVDHIEEDLNTIIYTLDKYHPDLILADEGYNMNYNDKLKTYFGINHVYGVLSRSARSNGDATAHYNETTNVVTIDKLSQVLLLMASLRRGDFRFYRGKYGLDDMERLYIQHANNVVIRADEVVNNTTHQIEEQLIITRKGGDHLFIAMVYAYVAMRRIIAERSNQQIDISSLGNTVQFEQTDLQKELNVERKEIDF